MKKILVPCDFSPQALNALRTAVGYGAIEPSEVHVLHVIELPIVHDSLLMPVINFEDSLLEELRRKAEQTYHEAAAEFQGNGTAPKYTVSFGPISRVILSFIKDNNIDLVIMGTKGASGLQEVFIGSNTEKIVRASSAPVLVVREPFDFRNVHDIVFPTNVDFDAMEDFVRRVKTIQHLFKATLHLVWINTPGNFSNNRQSLAKLEEFAHRYMLVDYRIHVFNDKYEESGIIRFCHHIKADLLVMATHGRKGLAHMFGGSLTEDVVNHIDLPVLTLSVTMNESKVPN